MYSTWAIAYVLVLLHQHDFFSFRDEYLWLTWNFPTNPTYSWSVGMNEASPDIAVQYHVSWHDEHHNVNDSSARRDSQTIKRHQRSIIADLSHSFSSWKIIARWYRVKRHVLVSRISSKWPLFFQPCWNPPFQGRWIRTRQTSRFFNFHGTLGGGFIATHECSCSLGEWNGGRASHGQGAWVIESLRP